MNRMLTRFILALMTATLILTAVSSAHPLGNFTINHYARIEPAPDHVGIRYVVDMAEIAAFQELQRADADGDGRTSEAELSAFQESAAARYVKGCVLEIDGRRLALNVVAKKLEMPAGSGGLPTLRLEFDFAAPIKAGGRSTIHFKDSNDEGRLGWRELVVQPSGGTVAFDGDVYAGAITDELRSYPADWLAEPLSETEAEFSVGQNAIPAGSVALRSRDGRPVETTRDRLAELIAIRSLTPATALLGLLFAVLLGALHAMSPGHGKTVVGAYLVGSRGTARHAAFLGLTVTVTHTAGVFCLGLITLFASKYVLPEKLTPGLSLVSGICVIAIGIRLIRTRALALLGRSAKLSSHHHGHDDSVGHGHDDQAAHQIDHDPRSHSHSHSHSHAHDSHSHSPDGNSHSHLPPGADGSPVTWRSLLALGVSGGIVPCPSALVVLLSAISLHRVGYGLLLVTAFSFGLAAVLTAVGLLFVYAGRLISKPLQGSSAARLIKIVPLLSSIFVTLAGAAISYEALGPAGLNVFEGLRSSLTITEPWLPALSILGIGFILGLKHAVEADHLAAITVIVTESKSVLKSSLVGAAWGLGHTLSLSMAGMAVIVFRLTIGDRTALLLELVVGGMLILLGLNALRKLPRDVDAHAHEHRHGEHLHEHLHSHRHSTGKATATIRGGLRPLLVGMMHGLAGSAALVLLVVATTKSVFLALIYILVFGLGSTGGMMLVSALVSLPLLFGSWRVARLARWIRGSAGAFSIVVGLIMVYELGVSRWL